MNREEYFQQIKNVDWTLYETAYGNAGEDIPDYVNPKKYTPKMQSLLMQLLSEDHEEAMMATHHLWCSLCHEYAFISSAALPAFDFLLYGLKTLDNQLKVELLDIICGFVVVISKEQPMETWQGRLRQKVAAERTYFDFLTESEDEDIAYFAKSIIEEL